MRAFGTIEVILRIMRPLRPMRSFDTIEVILRIMRPLIPMKPLRPVEVNEANEIIFQYIDANEVKQVN